MENEPQFKIHGTERRTLKKRLSFLKSFVKTFWYDHQMEKDMSSFYGGNMMSDEDAQKMFDEKTLSIVKLEEELAVPYEI
jgi:hypothetical protein